jgi:Na+/H+-dicarboxylate symporter
MSRKPRFAGYALMVVAALLAVAMREQGIERIGPFPVIAVALLIGMIGVMLVFTDLMVRGLYAQVDAAKAREEEDKGG